MGEETKTEEVVEETKQKDKDYLKVIKKGLNHALNEAAVVFSLPNLTISLASVLTVIFVNYVSTEISKLMEAKFYANPTMYIVFTMVVLMSYFLAILGPAIVYAIRTKKWLSLVYIPVLEIIWLAIFLAVLFFTTADKTFPTYNFQ